MSDENKKKTPQRPERFFGGYTEGLGSDQASAERYDRLDNFEHRGQLARAEKHGLAQTGQRINTLDA